MLHKYPKGASIPVTPMCLTEADAVDIPVWYITIKASHGNGKPFQTQQTTLSKKHLNISGEYIFTIMSLVKVARKWTNIMPEWRVLRKKNRNYTYTYWPQMDNTDGSAAFHVFLSKLWSVLLTVVLPAALLWESMANN